MHIHKCFERKFIFRLKKACVWAAVSERNFGGIGFGRIVLWRKAKAASEVLQKMQVFTLGQKYPGIVNVSAGSPKNLVDFWGALAYLPSISCL